MKTPQRALMLASAFLFVAACNKGIHLNESGMLSDNTTFDTGTGGSGVDPGNEPPSSGWQLVRAAAEGKSAGSSFDEQLLLQIDTVNQALIFLVPVPFPSLLIPVTEFEVSQLPGVKVFQVTDSATGNTSIAVRVPLKYMVKTTNLQLYGTLPNGDAIPGIPTGETRGFAIAFPETPDLKLNLYVGPNAAAAFIEMSALKVPEEWLKFPLQFPVRNASGTSTVGYLGIVPNKGAYNGGVFVSSQLSHALAGALDGMLRY